VNNRKLILRDDSKSITKSITTKFKIYHSNNPIAKMRWLIRAGKKIGVSRQKAASLGYAQRINLISQKNPTRKGKRKNPLRKRGERGD